MLLTISFTFIVLTGPIVLLNSIWPEENYPYLSLEISIILEYLNHAINGFLYCLSGSRFRNELKKLFLFQKRASHFNSHSLSSNNQSNTTAVSDVGSTLSKM